MSQNVTHIKTFYSNNCENIYMPICSIQGKEFNILTQLGLALIRHLRKLALVLFPHRIISLLERMVLIILGNQFCIIANLHLPHGLLVFRVRPRDLHVNTIDLIRVILFQLVDLIAQLLDRLAVALVDLAHLVVVLQGHLAHLVGLLGLEFLYAGVEVLYGLDLVTEVVATDEDLVEMEKVAANG